MPKRWGDIAATAVRGILIGSATYLLGTLLGTYAFGDFPQGWFEVFLLTMGAVFNGAPLGALGALAGMQIGVWFGGSGSRRFWELLGAVLLPLLALLGALTWTA